MINANELRIGNYYIDVCGETNKWELRFYQYYAKHPLTGENLYDQLKPVPLTPEILEKSGFDYLAWEGFLEFTHMINSGIILRLTGSGVSVFNISACDQSLRQFITTVKYVHQLQNIYHALTGKELEINL